jgi:hypothetical protein
MWVASKTMPNCVMVDSPSLLAVRCHSVDQMRLASVLCRYVELAEGTTSATPPDCRGLRNIQGEVGAARGRRGSGTAGILCIRVKCEPVPGSPRDSQGAALDTGRRRCRGISR